MSTVGMHPSGDLAMARQFFAVAIGSLLVSGVLSLALVVARTPGLDRLIEDPMFFKRALVSHVALALVVWFHAFVAGLCALLPSARPMARARAAPLLCALGAFALALGPIWSGANPILSNYVPVIEHPVFIAGLCLFAAGVLLAIMGGPLLPPRFELGGLLTPSAQAGLRAAAVLLIASAATFAAAFWGTPRQLLSQAYYESLFWGGGHLLQFVTVAAMLAVWLLLLERALARPLFTPRTSSVLFALLTAPALYGLYAAAHPSTSGAHREGFTQLMRWGIFPVVLVFLGRALYVLGRHPKRRELLRDARVMGFLASAGLCVLGFVLGAFIRGSTTLVPAHYHASIGAVSAAFMTATFVLCEPLGLGVLDRPSRALARWQPVLFGVGQAVFALGFGFAGLKGAGRKLYGAEQARRTLSESAGLGVMALGGLAAVAAGLLFLGLVLRAAYRRGHPAPLANPSPRLEANHGRAG